MELTRKAKQKCKEQFLPKVVKKIKKSDNATFSESQSTHSDRSERGHFSDVLDDYSGSNLNISTESETRFTSPVRVGSVNSDSSSPLSLNISAESETRVASPVRVDSVPSSPLIRNSARRSRALSPISDVDENPSGEGTQVRSPHNAPTFMGTPAQQGN